MRYISTPNLPVKAVKLVIVDGRINEYIEGRLKGMGIQIIKTKPYIGMYNAVAYHPDIMLNHLGYEYVLYAPGTDAELLDQLKAAGFSLIKGSTELDGKYPRNICYNAAIVGSLVLHNLNYTDPVLKSELEKRGMKFIHVKQGYTKCSVSVVDEQSIITSDKGIAKEVSKYGVEVLLIEPEESIKLHEIKHGFIGGSTGMLHRNKWAIAGNIEHLNSANSIKEFLSKRDMEVVSLYDGPVSDIGTILPIGQSE